MAVLKTTLSKTSKTTSLVTQCPSILLREKIDKKQRESERRLKLSKPRSTRLTRTNLWLNQRLKRKLKLSKATHFIFSLTITASEWA